MWSHQKLTLHIIFIIIATLPNWAQYNRQQQSHFSEHHNRAINIKEPKLSIKRVLGLLHCFSLVLKKVYFSNGNVYGDPPPPSMLMTPKTKMFFMASLNLDYLNDSDYCHDNQEYLVGPNMIRVTLNMV